MHLKMSLTARGNGDGYFSLFYKTEQLVIKITVVALGLCYVYELVTSSAFFLLFF